MIKMKTTNKLFKTQVQEHILNILGHNDEADRPYTLQEVAENFLNEKYSSPYERKFSKENMFKEWLGGLPSSLNVEYMNEDIHNTLKSWYENVGDQYDPKKLQTDEWNWYTHLVTREFKTLCTKNNIKF
jgi:hypothetical protein